MGSNPTPSAIHTDGMCDTSFSDQAVDEPPPRDILTKGLSHELGMVLIKPFLRSSRQFLPIRDLRYNPEKDTFEDVADGRELTRSDFNKLAESKRGESGNTSRGGRSRAAGDDGGTVTAGRSTLERAVFTQTLLSAESGEVRGALLERLGSLGSERLVDILYSESSEARPSAGLSGSGRSDSAPRAQSVVAAIRKALGVLAGNVPVVQSVADILGEMSRDAGVGA